MMEFLVMGGHGPFVWGSYAVTALALVVEMFLVRARRRAAFAITAEGDRP